MITRLSKKMASFFVCQKIIEAKNEEVYEYGMELLLSTFFNGLIAIVLSLITNTFWFSLVYLSTFVIMRKSAGGFHAKTHLGCCCILVIVQSIFIVFIKIVPSSTYFIVAICTIVFSFFINIMFAPLENENKPISSDDKIRLRRISLRYSLIFSVGIVILGVFHIPYFMVSVALGMFTSSGSILAAKIQEKLK